MKSGPSEQQVLDELSDKVVSALSAAVAATRADLTDYRLQHAGWVVDASNRGLLNWINDRLWAHIVRELDDVATVAFVESGPTREMYVNSNFRIRFKKHDINGLVRTYPTQTALDFMLQEQGVLDGMEQIRLCAGYIWDGLEREIGPAVLSLRDGQDLEDIIWVHHLDGDADSGSLAHPIHPPTAPSTPTIVPPVTKPLEEPGTS